MKIFKTGLLIAAMIMVLFSCSPKTSLILPSAQLQRQWMLKKLVNADDALVLDAKTYINLTDAKRATAKAGCNNISFAYKAEGSKLSFGQGMATKMFCEKYMPAETALLNILPRVASYDINGHKITFKDLSGNILAEGVAADWD